MFPGAFLSALPMYTFPFTTVGEEFTIDSFVAALQIWSHWNCPQGFVRHARICAVLRPTNTTPFATVGDERIAA
jgi:hypothetical protein